MGRSTDIATLGGGCFWCLEAIFKDLRGVDSVISGYAGGQVKNPTYQEVCTGTTGHAEVVQITFDPAEVGFRDLLRIFFVFHDPTTLDRQGEDVGSQYRSVIFTRNDEETKLAHDIKGEVGEQALWPRPVVTEVTPFESFYPAEAYHKDYFLNNPGQGYCRVVIAPKVSKFRKEYVEYLKDR
jgi:peptide-methionine (S)-S-oxide reductase